MEENNNKKEPKQVQIKLKLRTLIIIVIIIVILLASNVFAGVMGYGNIFFVIKNLVTTGTLEGKKDIFSDKEITISYATIKLLEDVELQVNKLQIRENNSTLIMQYKDDRKDKTDISLELSDEKSNVLCSKIANDGELQMNIDRQIDETEKLSLVVKSNNEYVKTLVIDLESREIVVQGEEAVSKISEIELKQYLNYFSLANMKSFENKNDKYVYIAYEFARKFNYKTTVNEINSIIESMFDEEFEYKNVKNSKGEDIEILNTDVFLYDDKENCYTTRIGFTSIENGLCLKIEDISYKDNLYTVKFIYSLPTALELDDNLEKLDQFEATIELEYDENSKYSKYKLVNLSKGSLIEKTEKEKIGFTKSGYTAIDDFLPGNSNDNGLIALEKIGENGLKTEKHDGYYTYIDGWNNKYNIKEITGAKSEYAKTSNDGLDKLYKVTLNYINEKDKNLTVELAIIIGNTESFIIGNFDSYTGSTRFVKAFTDLYDDPNDSGMVEDCDHEYVVLKGVASSGEVEKATLDGTHVMKCSKCGTEKEAKHSFSVWNDISKDNVNEWMLWCTECDRYVYTQDENVVKSSGYNVRKAEMPSKNENQTANCILIDEKLIMNEIYDVYYFDPEGNYKSSKTTCLESGKINFDITGSLGKYQIGMIFKYNTNDWFQPTRNTCIIDENGIKKVEYTEIETELNDSKFVKGENYKVFYFDSDGKYKSCETKCDEDGKVKIVVNGPSGTYKIGVVTKNNSNTDFIQLDETHEFFVDSFGNAK